MARLGSKEIIIKELAGIAEQLPTDMETYSPIDETRLRAIIDRLHLLAEREPGLVTLKLKRLPPKMASDWADKFSDQATGQFDEGKATRALTRIEMDCVHVTFTAMKELQAFGLRKSFWMSWQGRLVIFAGGLVIGFFLGAWFF